MLQPSGSPASLRGRRLHETIALVPPSGAFQAQLRWNPVRPAASLTSRPTIPDTLGLGGSSGVGALHLSCSFELLGVPGGNLICCSRSPVTCYKPLPLPPTWSVHPTVAALSLSLSHYSLSLSDTLSFFQQGRPLDCYFRFLLYIFCSLFW
jgi:hypothetical protein